MKKLLFPAFILLFVWSCSSIHKADPTRKHSVIINDSTEYEITIIDPEFDHWYLLNYSEAKDHTNEFYRSKNQVGVINWNDYYNRGRYHNVIENYIYYDNSIDYGIEVNRKLFWYFKYTEDQYKIHLLQ